MLAPDLASGDGWVRPIFTVIDGDAEGGDAPRQWVPTMIDREDPHPA